MASVAPLFEEHADVARIAEKGPHSDLEKLQEMVQNIQEGVNATEGVLATYVALAPNLVDGKVAYIEYFRTKDKEARERALLKAHEEHGKHLIKYSKVSKDLLGKVEVPGAKDHHSDFHKLSAARLSEDFAGTSHLDWETRPIGSHAAKFPAVRVTYVEYKEGISPDLITAHHELLAGLPTKFHQIKQVSFGKNTTHLYKESQLYPDTGLVHWDLGVVFMYASTEDRAELDSNPEFMKSREWSNSLFETFEVYDMVASSVNR